MFLHYRTGRIVFLVLAATLAAAAGCAQSSDRDTAQAADKVYRMLTGAPEPASAVTASAVPIASSPVPAAPAPSATVVPAVTATAASAPASPPPPSPAATGTGGPTPPPPARPEAVASGEFRLTLADFLRRTLAANPDIQIAGYGPPEAREDIIVAQAVFDPVIFGNSTASRTDRPIQSILDVNGTLTQGSLIQQTWSFQGGVRDKIPTGGTFAVYQSSDYLDTNSDFSVPNPQYSTRLTFEFSQPLLRSGGVDYNLAPVRVATLNSDISVQDFRKGVTDTIATAISTYWQLLFDLEAVRVSQASLDLAAEVMRREKAHQELGVSSEVELHRAESAVALRQADVIRAQNQARDDMDHLKLLMNSSDLPLSGDTEIVPVETPRFYIADINRAEAITTALAHRPELERARNAIAINRIRADVADEDRLPQLNATLRYVLNGLGKAFHQGIEQQSFTELNTWSAGLEFELPIGNRAADATYRRRLMEYDQALVDLERQALQATQEVNSAVRAVLQSRQEVEATLEATYAASRQVQGEQRRFELGQTTNDELLRAQETLATAQRDYLKALLNFNLGMVSLARAEGVMLENQGIEVFSPEPTAGHPQQPLRLRSSTAKEPAPPPGVRLIPSTLGRGLTPPAKPENR